MAVPLIGQTAAEAQAAEEARKKSEAQAAALAQQVAMGMFVSLYPQLAIYRASHGYPVEGGLTEDSTPGRVADEAGAYVAAGMAKLGFHRE